MTDAQFLLIAVVVVVAALFVVEQAVEWVGRLARWLDK